ncbi:Uncharacterized protein DAT39_002861, partial [Clarias magur]
LSGVLPLFKQKLGSHPGCHWAGCSPSTQGQGWLLHACAVCQWSMLWAYTVPNRNTASTTFPVFTRGPTRIRMHKVPHPPTAKTL